MKNLFIFAAAFALAFAAPAAAGEYEAAGPYIGAGVANGKYREDCNFTRGCDYRQNGLQAFGGYMLNENFGVEGGLVLIDGFKGKGVTADSPPSPFDVEVDFNTFYLSGIARVSLHERFAAFAKAGFHRWEADSKSSIPLTPSLNLEDDDIDFFFGAGVEAAFTPQFSARLEYGRFKISGDLLDNDLDVIALSAIYRIGK